MYWANIQRNEMNQRAQFFELDNRLKSKDETVEALPDEVRLKLYGLSKQYTEGTCRMPIPPRYLLLKIYGCWSVRNILQLYLLVYLCLTLLIFPHVMIYSSNVILRAKWESWTVCANLSKDQAMEVSTWLFNRKTLQNS